MSGEVGGTWTGRLLNVCMQEGRLEEEEKRRREEKLSDEAVEKFGGGQHLKTLTKGKIGRERIYYVYGLLCTM